MLSTIFANMVRHPRLVLGGAVVLAVGFPGLRALLTRGSIARPAVVLLIVTLALISAGLGVLSLRQQRPAAFVVDPRTPAFRTMPHALHVCGAVAVILMTADQVVLGLQLTETDQDSTSELGTYFLIGIDSVLAVLAVALCAVWVVAVWRGLGLQLRPDGLIDRRPSGSLIVPWEALAPGYPHIGPPPNNNLVLTYARPDLVRRRGLIVNWRQIPTLNIHPAFLGSAIAHYVWYPQHRAAIGTQAEHDRLYRAFSGGPPSEHET